tara:strand:+ start:3974 stop:5056 length:1083 start_codon:yes stop_codon:yes gene_type:complete
VIENMLDFGMDDSRDAGLEPIPIPPATVKVVETDDTHGLFIIEPLPRGFGMTLGNPLRRVLLSSIPGTAIDWIRIDGVQHEYTTVPGVKEDVVDIMLNIKAVDIRSASDRPGKLRLEVDGPGQVTAGDIMVSSDFEIVNPELHIATLDSAKARLTIEMNVEQGRGYQPAAAHEGLPIGVLPVDAIFTPVRKVNYSVERTRVGQHTDFERLILDVWTSGAVSPSEAIRQGAQELVEHFFRFSTVTDSPTEDSGKPSWAAAIPASQYNMVVESLGLSARTLNCLKRAAIHKVGEVLEKSRSELLHIRNFGERSLEELDEKLELIGIKHPELRIDEMSSSDNESTDSLDLPLEDSTFEEKSEA